MTQLRPIGNLEITDRVTVDDEDIARGKAWAEADERRQAKRAERERNAKCVEHEPWHGATSWSFGEREKWGEGPWNGEPDKVLWRDQATGMHCMLRRGAMGSWCGYVALEPGHAMHGKGYDEVHKALPDLTVHGGLTYAEPCDEAGGSSAICHDADGDEPAWWLGFDCAHYGDFTSQFELEGLGLRGLNKAERAIRRSLCGRSREQLIAEANETYKTVAWVRAEVEELAQQLKAVAS